MHKTNCRITNNVIIRLHVGKSLRGLITAVKIQINYTRKYNYLISALILIASNHSNVVDRI